MHYKGIFLTSGYALFLILKDERFVLTQCVSCISVTNVFNRAVSLKVLYSLGTLLLSDQSSRHLVYGGFYDECVGLPH